MTIQRFTTVQTLIMSSRQSDYETQLLSSYNMVYAREVADVLWEVVREHCNGCIINHESQHQHSCIMLSELQHLELYYELALEKVGIEVIMPKWKEEIKYWNIPKDNKDSFAQNLQDAKWRKTLNVSNAQSVYTIVEKMVKLSGRFH